MTTARTCMPLAQTTGLAAACALLLLVVISILPH
jgi:hypothetical protein